MNNFGIPSIFLNGNTIATLVFLFVVLFCAGATIIMFFHWKKYGMGGAKLAMAETIYLTVSVVLLTVAFFNLP